MLALRPVVELAPAAPLALAGASPPAATSAVSPPAWWALRSHAHVLEAVRDVGRAVLARKIDARAANTSLQALQLLLAEKRARRTWHAVHLRDRMRELVAEAEATAERSTLSRGDLEGMAELARYVATLARRAHP